MIAASLMHRGLSILRGCPRISDVFCMEEILKSLGAVTWWDDHDLYLDCSCADGTEIPAVYTGRMRSSIILAGAVLARNRKCRIGYPGGCTIGSRPIDQHLKGFRALGSDVKIVRGAVVAHAIDLVASHIYLDVVSVGATINIMMAATMAEGETILENVAKEPHVVDVANFLNSMGANIKGAGTDVIRITGVSALHKTEYSIIPDQIEAGTFMFATAVTGGNVVLQNVIPKHLEAISAKLIEMGCEVTEFDEAVRVVGRPSHVHTDIKTLPYPGFPTDMQPQITTLLTLAEGTSIITEGVWEQRFRYVDELRRMGADISVDGKVAVVEGTGKLTGAPVKACDLRAGAALIVAGLAAHGVTEIEDIYHIERGYANLDAKLRQIGADIQKVSDPAIPAKLKEAL